MPKLNKHFEKRDDLVMDLQALQKKNYNGIWLKQLSYKYEVNMKPICGSLNIISRNASLA
jgi:hypothetical protein